MADLLRVPPERLHAEAVEQPDEPRGPVGAVHVDHPDPELGEPIPDLAPPRGPGAPDLALPPVRLEPALAVPLPARDAVPPPPTESLSPLARRRLLREQNSDAVTDLAHLTGRPHAELNAELNRRLKIRRISEATVRQLQQRLELARKMLRG